MNILIKKINQLLNDFKKNKNKIIQDVRDSINFKDYSVILNDYFPTLLNEGNGKSNGSEKCEFFENKIQDSIKSYLIPKSNQILIQNITKILELNDKNNPIDEKLLDNLKSTIYLSGSNPLFLNFLIGVLFSGSTAYGGVLGFNASAGLLSSLFLLPGGLIAGGLIGAWVSIRVVEKFYKSYQVYSQKWINDYAESCFTPPAYNTLKTIYKQITSKILDELKELKTKNEIKLKSIKEQIKNNKDLGVKYMDINNKYFLLSQKIEAELLTTKIKVCKDKIPINSQLSNIYYGFIEYYKGNTIPIICKTNKKQLITEQIHLDRELFFLNCLKDDLIVDTKCY